MKTFFLICGIVLSAGTVYAQKKDPCTYRQASAPIEERVDDLLGRMTLKEKIGQICCPLGWEMYTKIGDDSVTVSEKYKEQMAEAPIGSYWAVLRADPWTQKTLETGLNPELAAKALNALQRYAVEETRLGIPILFAEECPHGHMAIGTTVFPTSLSQASTWNRQLIQEAGQAIALEARSQGANIGYGPVLDLARDPRWSRVEETFGEDPYLTGALGTELVKGMQGTAADIRDGRHVYSTLKHFAAYGIPRGGHNGNPADIGYRALMDEHLPAFRQAVEEGKAATVMTSYNSIDGIPCTCNAFLLDSVLRKKWGFEGMVYSDLTSIDGIAGAHVAADIEDAAIQAIKAGTDMDLGANAYKKLAAAVEKGLIQESYIDRAVKNVLRLKFRMGLFENPYVSPRQAKQTVNCEEHRMLARKVAREGTVLLKNDGILPLNPSALKRVAVIGPNADMMYNYLGDYTAPQERKKIVTVLDAIRARLPHATVTYVKGCAIRDTTQSDIEAAVKAAKGADVVILVVGGSSARDFKTQYIQTGAATVSDAGKDLLPDMECGEGFDRATLNLLGDQEKLIGALAATRVPLVTVYIAGRPLNMNLANEKSDALLTAWYPGEQGGHGIADILLGDYNPSGRLPLSVPRNEGQLPVHYSQGPQRDYMDSPGTPLFSFGYGLSYTTFAYSNLRLEEGNGKDIMQKVTCTVSNTGNKDGEEVVQLYLNDPVSSVAVPPIRLKGFEKIFLKKGESKDVSFFLTRNDLSITDRNLHFVAEPGRYKVMIGGASDNLPLQGVFKIK